MKTLTILLVTDTLADVSRIRAALPESSLPLHLHVVQTGLEALVFLRGLNSTADAHRPDFIIVDVTVPQQSRRELIAALRQESQLSSVPVVLLPTPGH
jgi:CheY-like chemotaxis protein